MKEELLKIVCTEYRKMTGLDMVDINASLPGRHIDFLKERLTVNYGFKIMKGCRMNTINDFVKAIQAAYDFLKIWQNRRQKRQNRFAAGSMALSRFCLRIFRGKTVVFINTSFVRFCLRGIR